MLENGKANNGYFKSTPEAGCKDSKLIENGRSLDGSSNACNIERIRREVQDMHMARK
jgi:hypothetical protein